MKTNRKITLLLILTSLLLSSCATNPEKQTTQKIDTSNWKIKDIYNYLKTNGGELSAEEVKPYAEFIIDNQNPETGIFVDRFGESIYSVKAYHLLKRFGYEPKYPLGVCQGRYCHGASEKMSRQEFRDWLDLIYKKYKGYPAGSIRGHFISPHVMNLRKQGKSPDDSPYVQEFRKWIIENQGENGFWNRPDDDDWEGWSGAMKMDEALKKANIEMPNPDRMIKTVLKCQDTEKGTYYAGGGCANHNALHTLRQWSKRFDMLMWEDVFCSMERHAGYVQRRYDPETGFFRPPPGYDCAPNPRATEVTAMEVGNIIGYCNILLKPENAQLIAVENQNPPSGQQPITKERIINLLVKARGLGKIAQNRFAKHSREKYEKKYGKPAEKK